MVGHKEFRILQKDSANDMSLIDKWEYFCTHLKNYGVGVLSYSNLQKDLHYLIHDDYGFLCFYEFKNSVLGRRGIRVIVADPICDKKYFGLFAKEILNTPKQVIFLQISEAFARILHKMGYKVNQLGVETEINLEGFSMDSRNARNLRRTVRKLKKMGIEVFEKDISEMDEKQIRGLSQEWVKRKGGHELILLTRPLVYESEPEVRYFWARYHGELIGMIIYDPIYERGSKVGYYQNFVRIRKDAKVETSDFMTVVALETFKKEGLKKFSFGLSPLSGLDDKSHGLKYNKRSSLVCKFLYNYGNSLYPFKGNELFKKKYHGIKRKVFFVTTNGNTLFDFLRAMKALRIF